MSRAESDDGPGPTYAGFRTTEERKREMRMRAAQVGADDLSDYLRSLVDDDLRGAELPDLSGDE